MMWEKPPTREFRRVINIDANAGTIFFVHLQAAATATMDGLGVSALHEPPQAHGDSTIREDPTPRQNAEGDQQRGSCRPARPNNETTG